MAGIWNHVSPPFFTVFLVICLVLVQPLTINPHVLHELRPSLRQRFGLVSQNQHRIVNQQLEHLTSPQHSSASPSSHIDMVRH